MKGPILVVEDGRNEMELILRTLEQNGYFTVPYSDGHEAEESIRQGLRYKLALIDLSTNVDGNELAKISKEFSPKAPVVIMSGFPVGHMSHVYSSKNWDFHIAKPFGKKDLLEKIDSFFQGNQSLQP